MLIIFKKLCKEHKVSHLNTKQSQLLIIIHYKNKYKFHLLIKELLSKNLKNKKSSYFLQISNIMKKKAIFKDNKNLEIENISLKHKEITIKILT